MRRAWVVGCGYVGTAFGLVMARAGWTVTGVRRDPRGLPPELVPVAADVSRPGTLEAALDRARAGSPGEGPEVVVYAVSADERSEAAYRAAYVDGLLNVLRALESRGEVPRRLLYVSSTAVYGGRNGAWVDEETPLDPEGFRQELLVEGEAAAHGGPAPSVVLRLAGIYGPGRTSLVERVRRGEATCPPAPPVYTNRVHRDDAAGMLAHLATVTAPADTYIGVDRDPAEICTVYRWLARRVGAPPPRPGGEEAESRRRRTNKRCSGARIAASGYVVRYPSFREGYAALLGVRSDDESTSERERVE